MTNTALEAASKRRKELYDAMVAVEHAAQRPAKTDAWHEELVAALQRVAAAFKAHVVATEDPDGIIAQIVTDAPRLANEAERLGAEHPVLEDRISNVAAKVKAAGIPDKVRVIELREDILGLLGALSLHRSAGSDFVWDAYAVDIGGYG
ncbi:MAG: hypothetical protein KJP12_02675 [Acidimicrobiia bacterium]|nr:hypothetical protein [Acidimicrobiia bacterium]